jgi:CubicO group peptidase (beta-lactamase class C family)
VAAGSVPVPVFADAQRLAKLSRAFGEVDAIVARTVKQSRRPGAVLGVIVDGELVHVATAGVQDLQSNRPVSADTVFRIASMTKSFTAMAILKLRDAGKLSLEDPADRYVPELARLAYPTSDSPRLTIRHLMSHAGGLPEDNPWGDRQLARSDDWMAAALGAGIPFSTAPGTAYEYSNYGFAILGRIVQHVAGEPYERFVTREILQPLGMEATTFDTTQVPAARRTRGYGLEGQQHVPIEPLPHGSFGAMGGLWTSARDLAKYVAFLMAAFPPRDDPERGPISRASAREMQQVARHDASRATRGTLDGPLRLSTGGYGYGLRVSEDCDLGVMIGHGGGLPGYGSLMSWYPERGVGLIAMSNLTYSGWGGVFREVFEALRKAGGLERRRVQPSPALLEAQAQVSRLVSKWDEALAGRIAADNLWLDRSAESRRAHVESLTQRHGACGSPSAMDAENALRGRWRMTCDRGFLQVSITLAPTMPPLVQYLDVRGVLPPAPPLQKAIDEVVGLIGRWDDARARAVVAPDVDLQALMRQAQMAGLQAGTCRAGETLVGDGTRALLRLECDRGSIWADVVLDTSTGKATRVVLMPDGERSCAM